MAGTGLSVVRNEATEPERLAADYVDDRRAKGLAPASISQARDVIGKQFVRWCADQGVTTPADLDQRLLDHAARRRRSAR